MGNALALFLMLIFLGPRSTHQQDTQTHAAQHESKNSNSVVPPAGVVASPSAAEPECQPEPANQEQAATQQPQNWFLRPDWVIVWVTVAYTVISGFTLLLIKQQGKDFRSQLKNATEAERAWIIDTIDPMVDLPPSGEPLAVLLTATNLGRTVARITELTVRFHLIDPKDAVWMGGPPDYRESWESRVYWGIGLSGRILAPQQAAQFTVIFEDWLLDPQHREELYRSSAGYTRRLVVYGKFVYDTAYQQSRVNRFCYFWEPPTPHPDLEGGFRRTGPDAFLEAT